MNDTNPEVYAGQAFRQNLQLRDQLEKVRGNLQSHIAAVSREVQTIQAALRIKYTPWIALLKLEDGKWRCLACVNGNEIGDDTPMDFDVALPIPDPETMPEFNGF
jgi:hypothetical protein